MQGDANPIVSAGFVGLHALYQRRDVTPVEVLEAHLARIARLNPGLNCVVALDEAGARAAAARSAARWRVGKPLGALDGAPVLVKANVAVRALPWTGAIAAYRHRIAVEDAALVARLRGQGAIVLGLANMHEAALGATTTSPLYGPCINPLRAGVTPGGSSGGSAAAVAAGLCAGAIGTDTMGSVRIPSAYCGVVGFKPSAGRISRDGVVPLSARLDHVGVHARSIADASALYRAVAGIDTRDPHSQAFAAELKLKQGRRWKLSWLEAKTPACTPDVSCAYARAREAASAIAAVSVVDWGGLDPTAIRRAGLLICEAEMIAAHGAALDAPGAVSEDLRALLAYGARQSAVKLAQALAMAQPIAAWLAEMFQHADILITPCAPQTAFAHAQAAPATQADFTAFANFIGCPAVSIPAPVEPGGLPVGVQVIGPRGADGVVLAAAAALQAAFA